MSGPVEYPTHREVAVVVVAAARIYGEDPLSTVEGTHERRGRYMAFAALIEEFPTVPRKVLARGCGFGKSDKNASSNLALARRWAWWRDADLETVRAALSVAVAETDAELRNRVGTDALAGSDAQPKLKSEPASAPAAHAMASFQKARFDPVIKRKPDSGVVSPPPVLVPNGKRHVPERVAKMERAVVAQDADAAASAPLRLRSFASLDVVFRPDKPGGSRGAVPLPPEAYGDPPADYHARRAEAEARGRKEPEASPS